jgi:hypothetical protein
VEQLKLPGWFSAQFGAEREIYETVGQFAGLKVPFHNTGAFDVLVTTRLVSWSVAGRWFTNASRRRLDGVIGLDVDSRRFAWRVLRRRGSYREVDFKDGSPGGLAFEGDLSTVIFDDPFANRQPQS